MSPPASRKQFTRILTAVLNNPAWRRLLSIIILLPGLLRRIVCRLWALLSHQRFRQPPVQDGTTLSALDKSSTWPEVELTYTVIRDGNTVSLHGTSPSVYPFPGGSIRNTSRVANRPGSPNGRLTPSNRSVASLIAPYSTSPSVATSIHNLSRSELTNQETLPIERRDPEPHPRNPQRQDSEVPGIQVESPIARDFIPEDPTILEDLHCDSPRSSIHNHDTTLLGLPGGSAASSHTRVSSRPSSVASSEPPSWDDAWDDGWDLNPTFPTECLRYERRTKIIKKETDIKLDPLDFTFETSKIPDGWRKYAHPEGCCYFYNEDKKIFTDADLHDPDQCKLIEEEVERVEKAKKALGFPVNAEIVLNVYNDTDSEQNRQYYCMDHDRRVIFFFHEFHAKWVATWGEVEGAFSKSHFRYELESQYWYAVQMYPHRLKLSTDMVDELRDIVLHFIGDTMSSPYSTSEFTLGDLEKILSLTSNVEDNVGSLHTSGTLCLLARFMFMFNHSRFLHFHGESYARIERNFSVYGHALYPRTWFLRTLSLLLFSAPDVHLKNLQKMWVDKVLHKAVWEETLKKFSTEWQELVTSAAILLNANVAFLAIQSVDQQPPLRSWAQIISYASVVSNVGGMILGLLLIRKHRNIKQETSDHVHAFLRKHDSDLLGLEALAVMFSLPYALLMWGTVTFLTAFALMCLDVAGADTRITVGIALVLTGLLITWCIILFWENNEEDTSTEHRTLAYYPPKEKEEEGETDGTGHVSSEDVGVTSRARSLFNGNEAFRSSSALPAISKVESKPESLPAEPKPRLATVFTSAFRCIYTLGNSRNHREDATATV